MTFGLRLFDPVVTLKRAKVASSLTASPRLAVQVTTSTSSEATVTAGSICSKSVSGHKPVFSEDFRLVAAILAFRI